MDLYRSFWHDEESFDLNSLMNSINHRKRMEARL